MAGSVNKVILIGNLGADPEVKTMQSGDKLVNLSIATSETWKDKNGERQEKTEWHRVVIFNERLADVADRFLRKGSKVYLEGSLQTRKYQDQNGQDRYSTEIVLQKYRGELTMLDGRSEGQGGQTIAHMKILPDDATPEEVGKAFADMRQSAQTGQASGHDDDMSDTIPF